MSDEPLPGSHTHTKTELYDLGCTQHISPYHEDFENFENIPPMHFCAANKESFSAVGKGKMVIDVPDGADISQLQLTEVLYSPEVSYTLISIGKLNEKGFKATFHDGKCVIKGPDGVHIGAVPKTKKSIYKVKHKHELEEANSMTVETLTLEQLHCCMGHISPLITLKLMKDGFVTGV